MKKIRENKTEKQKKKFKSEDILLLLLRRYDKKLKKQPRAIYLLVLKQ